MVVGGVVQDVLGIGVILAHAGYVNMADTGVAALRLAGGPAGHLHAGKAHLGHGVDHFFIVILLQNGSDKTHFHRYRSSQNA